jgi:hypothetical protein
VTQPPPDEEFERRLRNVLHSRRLGVPVPLDAIDRIHAGARRRQQRRSGASVLGGVAIIAIAAVAIGVRPHGHGSDVAGNLRTASPAPTVAAASSATAAPSASVFASASAAPLSSAPPTSASAQPLTSGSSAAGQTVFTPVSVSAVGLNDYWVLGYTTTQSSDAINITTMVEQTTDSGQHFVAETTPPVSLAQVPTKGPAGEPTISQIRFGDANDGWTFGRTLYSTTNAGASWSAVNGISGGVVDLVAANNTAWALVQTASSSGAGSSAPSNQYALWSTSYGTGAQVWSPIALPISLGSTTPSIVDQDGTVTLMTPGPSRAGTKVHVLIGTAGKPFTDHTGPCEQDLGGTLSNSKKAIWAVCPTGTQASLYVSKDAGATWTANRANLQVENSAALGAIDDTNAVLFDAANQRLSKISGNTVTPTSVTGISDVAFLGFTTPAVGFAITMGNTRNSAQLLRTGDGGLTWSAVTF